MCRGRATPALPIFFPLPFIITFQPSLTPTLFPAFAEAATRRQALAGEGVSWNVIFFLDKDCGVCNFISNERSLYVKGAGVESLKSEMRKEVNPSVPRHKCRGLPFDKLKAPSIAEGLRVDPERRFLSPPSKAGLRAVERVKTQIKDNELVRSKRLQIAVGASKLFIKKGYSQTSIREISKATGLTIGNLYDYITKKEDILFLVFEVFYSTWVSRLEDEGVFAIEDPVLQLDTAVRKMLELVNTHREMVLLMYTETKLLPKGFQRIILEKESELVRYFETILQRGIEKGVFKVSDPFFAANMIVYLLSVEPLRGWNLRGRYRIEDINGQLMQFIKDAVTG